MSKGNCMEVSLSPKTLVERCPETGHLRVIWLVMWEKPGSSPITLGEFEME